MMYKKQDFDNCNFNPMSEGDLISIFPSIVSILEKQWIGDVNLDKILRYVIMVYDQKSPLNKSNISMRQKKIVASDLSGLNSINKDLLSGILIHDYKDLLPALIVNYVKTFSHSVDYAILISTEYKLWETINILMSPLKKDETKDMLKAIQEKEKILEEVEKDKSRIDTYYKIIYGDDSVLHEKLKVLPISPQTIGMAK